MLKKLIVLISLFLFSSIIFAEQLIIEPDMGREPILSVINSTQHTLDVPAQSHSH